MTIADISAERTIMVGDSGIDIRTAAAAGIASVGVAWGFRFAEELYDAGATKVASTISELEEILFS